MLIEVLLWYLVMSLVINLGIFLLAFSFQSDSFTDITYALSFIFLLIIALYNRGISHFFLYFYVSLVTLWALRLGIYLFMRIRFFGKDKRFDGMRNSFLKFGGFFTLQGLSVFMILIPAFLFITGHYFVFNLVSLIGVLIWIKGFFFEAIADYQKFKFIKQSKKSSKKRTFIQSGLWKYSRHPNYYGEILCWLGLYIMVFPSLYLQSLFVALIGFIGPLYIFILIRFVSGIPILEKSAQKRYGSSKDYQKYVRETGLLIPNFFR